jgi:hypothetical protein
MQKIGLLVIFGILILGLVGTLDDAFAETFTSVANGAWDSAGTWQDGMGDPGVPGPADTKFINHIVTMSSPVTNDGQIQMGGTLIIDSTFTNNGFYDGMTTNGLLSFGGNITVTSNGLVQNNGLYDNLSGTTTTIDDGGQFFNNFADGNAHFHNEGATVIVNGNLTNHGDIHQLTDGVMTINGMLTNSGSGAIFDNRIDATLSTSPFTNNSQGIIINESNGTITNHLGATITNDGNLVNRSGGVINNAGFITNNNSGTGFLNSGTVINTGTFTNNASEGGFTNINGGTINNTGFITNTGFNDSEITNNSGCTINNNFGGTITNNSGGRIENTSGGIINNNFGGIINNNFGSGIRNHSGSSFTNGGTIFSTGGITTWSDTTTFVNTGTLNIDFIVNWSGGTFNNNSGGIINITDLFQNGAGGNGGATLINNGIININGRLLNEDKNNISNLGAINNNSGGIIENTGTLTNNFPGIIKNFGTLDNDSNIDNFSTIINFNTLDNTGGTIDNSLKIINCGTYTGDLPNINMLLPCTITEDTTFTSDVTISDGTNMTINSGVVVTINPGVTLDVDKNANLTIKGGLMIKAGGALRLTDRGP